MYDIVYDVVYDIVRFLYDIVRTTYDIAKKRTISYVFDLFLPVVCATSYTTSYVFYRCRIRHRTFFHASSVLYDIVREVMMSIVTSTKTYDIVLRRRRQYRSIRYAIRSIRYACLGRRQARQDVLAMPLQLPRVLLPDPRPCRMVCIAQAQCRSPFPQSGTGRCAQCGW